MGKIIHYAFDLVLVLIILAGINRNTGLHFDTSRFSSVDIRSWFGKYLNLGEVGYDYTVRFLRMSGYFRERNFVLDSVKRDAGRVLKETTGLDIDRLKRT